MACFHPLTAWQRCEGAKPVFKFRADYKEIKLPCGQCIGCRLEYSRQWAVRLLHESKCHESTYFLTLTYDDANLPEGGSLRPADITKFFKKLRRRYGLGIRYFQCGEYGELRSRPHHHVILFNFDFPDRKAVRQLEVDCGYYTSEILDKLWRHGSCIIADFSFEAAAYVSRYVTKKLMVSRKSGEADKLRFLQAYYPDFNPDTGEFNVERIREYATQSRRPGIGKKFFEKFKSDIYPSDEVIIKGRVARPPRYYDYLYDIESPDDMKAIKENRVKEAAPWEWDRSPDRLLVREIVCESKFKEKKRRFEND